MPGAESETPRCVMTRAPAPVPGVKLEGRGRADARPRARDREERWRSMAETWRRCSACKTPIALGAIHYVCSVSTCNRARTALAFCSVDCWEIHLPTERHRQAWAIEARAPATPEPRTEPGQRAPRRSRAGGAGVGRGAAGGGAAGGAGAGGRSGAGRGAAGGATGVPEILVVASRLKSYIRGRAGYNTSDAVLPILSEAIRKLCDEAIRNARRAQRETVLDRDVPGD